MLNNSVVTFRLFFHQDFSKIKFVMDGPYLGTSPVQSQHDS